MNLFVFGPVPSRRFGRSLGVNTVPGKTCNYSCVYCQLGRTGKLQAERKTHFNSSDVVEEIRSSLDQSHGKVDFVTIMGEGEPTLALNLEEILRGMKDYWNGGTALITNGSLFSLPEVRQAAKPFDVVSPTIAAGDEKTYRKLHRPHRSLKLERVIDGLVEFRKEYPGEIWVEVMLVRGLNDSERSLMAIGSAIEMVSPNRVYIGAPIRPPSEKLVLPPTEEAMALAMDILPNAIDMTMPERGDFGGSSENPISNLLEIAANHPLREDEALTILADLNRDDGERVLSSLIEQGRLERKRYGETVFFRTPIK